MRLRLEEAPPKQGLHVYGGAGVEAFWGVVFPTRLVGWWVHSWAKWETLPLGERGHTPLMSQSESEGSQRRSARLHRCGG